MPYARSRYPSPMNDAISEQRTTDNRRRIANDSPDLIYKKVLTNSERIFTSARDRLPGGSQEKQSGVSSETRYVAMQVVGT